MSAAALARVHEHERAGGKVICGFELVAGDRTAVEFEDVAAALRTVTEEVEQSHRG